ncbi:MAG TPA: SGNH/GDSL hydrolase family protein [Planctomycetota bacterium]|nr:SGNH/GDSL hydrolase family protein [Planctomycetota bacterium]
MPADTAPASQRKPRASLGRKLALSLGVLVALLVLLELTVRTRQYVKHGTFGTMHQFVHDPASGLDIPPPGRVTANFAINKLGFRGPLVEMPKPAGTLRLAFLGASTTFCAEATSEEKTWPARVAAAAAQQRTEGSVDYVNAGVGGYLIDQIKQSFERRVAQFEPDVIFIYEATNDLTKDTRELAIAQDVYSGHSDEDSWLSRVSLVWYLVEKNMLLRSRKIGAVDKHGSVHFEARELSRNYRARIESLSDAAKARSKLVVLMTFSTQARREQDPARQFEACNTSFYYMPYMTPELLLDGFDEYNRVMREVAAEKGALLLDVAFAVPGDRRHFNDSVHFTDQGCAVFADAVIRGLQDSPQWNACIGTR